MQRGRKEVCNLGLVFVDCREDDMVGLLSGELDYPLAQVRLDSLEASFLKARIELYLLCRQWLGLLDSFQAMTLGESRDVFYRFTSVPGQNDGAAIPLAVQLELLN